MHQLRAQYADSNRVPRVLDWLTIRHERFLLPPDDTDNDCVVCVGDVPVGDVLCVVCDDDGAKS